MKQKIYIAGHTGLVGQALVRYFSRQPIQLITAKHDALDLTEPKAAADFLATQKPDVVILAAGRVGGIQANSQYPADFIYQNLMMGANVIHGAWQAGVKKLLNFGSPCVYPKFCSQPMKPDSLLTGKIEPTNEPYALAKLAGMSLCESYSKQYGVAYLNAIPSNLYGPGDSFDLERCHVLSSCLRKFHEAKLAGKKQVTLWGSGNVKRDFLFIDDLPEACDLLLKDYRETKPINISAQSPTTVRNLASQIADLVGFKGEVVWDTSKPDGAPERILDATAIRKLGWQAQTDLTDGLERTYRWFLQQQTTHAS